MGHLTLAKVLATITILAAFAGLVLLRQHLKRKEAGRSRGRN